MDKLIIYQKSDILTMVKQRDGEVKIGERVFTIGDLSELSETSAEYVLLGIPEDIGVRANFGIGGAKTAWQNALSAVLNMQSNAFLDGRELLILGHFHIEEPADQSTLGLREKTGQIDALVSPVIKKIVRAGKIPIVIGGGHNNALPIINGMFLGKGNQKVNVVNIDAHTDLRNPAEGRHSGNGFSSAIANGLLKNYRAFGIQRYYVHSNMAQYAFENPEVKIVYFEDLLLSNDTLQANWEQFIADLTAPCGLEIDLDSVENTLSSAMTPSGFSLNDIRKMLLTASRDFGYLHLCEGAAKRYDGSASLTIGKTIAYLIADFITALRLRNGPPLSS